MATDRQTPCLCYVCAGLCTKGRKRVGYKNLKKEKLEKIRRNERYKLSPLSRTF